MKLNQDQDNFSEVQAAIYGVALSLDALLLNGIQYGVLQQAAFADFLQKTANNLLRDLAELGKHAILAPVDIQTKVSEVVTTLRAKCQQLIELLTELSSFRSFSLRELRSYVGEILRLRIECVQLLQELEKSFRTPRPFYQFRPVRNAAAVDDFLANLEHIFTEEWANANQAVIK